MPAMSAADLLNFLGESFPQAAQLDLHIDHLDGQSIGLRLPVREQHLRPGGIISGPTLMWLADLAIYLLIMGRVGPVAQAVTTNLNINFLRPGDGRRDVLAHGRLLKLGSRLAVGEVSIRSLGSDEPVAHATLTYSIPSASLARNVVK